MVDHGESAEVVDGGEDLARRRRPAQPAERAARLSLEDGAGPVVDPPAGVLVGQVPAVGDDLGRGDHEVAGIARLVAADLPPGGVGHVVAERGEVESGAALGERLEGVAQRLGDRRRAQVGLLVVDVEVALVPAGLATDRGGPVAGGLVGVLGERLAMRELDLDAPGHAPVRVAVRGRDDRGHAELDGPAAGPRRPGLEAARRPPGDVALRVGPVDAVGREPLGGDRHLGVAGPAPPAELAPSPQVVAVAQAVVDPEVERVVVRARLGLVVAVTHADLGHAARHAERDHHVRALLGGPERAGHDPGGMDRTRAGARGGRRRRGGRGSHREPRGDDEGSGRTRHDAAV